MDEVERGIATGWLRWGGHRRTTSVFREKTCSSSREGELDVSLGKKAGTISGLGVGVRAKGPGGA